MGATASSAGDEVPEGRQAHCLGSTTGGHDGAEIHQPPTSSQPVYPFLAKTTSESSSTGVRKVKSEVVSLSGERKASRQSLRLGKVGSSGSRKKQLHVPVTWSSRKPTNRIFAVVRHGERADVLGSQSDGKPWTLTEESMRFPIDPPLSDVGRVEVVRTAASVKEFAERSSSHLQVVVSSLYLRCVQTAVEVCKKLGPGTKLMLDHALGEVYGPCVLGDIKPMTACRPFRYLARYARSQGVKIMKKPCGRSPEWPESLRKARERYATVFLTYMRRAEISRRNFVIVSHADCIASILALFPGKAGRMVESVSYAATVQGKLSQKKRNDAEDTTASFDSMDIAGGPPPVDRSPSDRMQWEVELDRIQMGPRWQGAAAATRAAKRAIANIGANKVDLSFLEELLGGLSEEPLGDVTPQSMSDTSAFDEDGVGRSSVVRSSEQEDLDLASSCSSSTYLYGESDTEQDLGSPDNNMSFESSVSVVSSEVKGGSSNVSPGMKESAPAVSSSETVMQARNRFSTDSMTQVVLPPNLQGGANVRSSSAGRVKLQGCGGSAIMARRAMRSGAGT